VLQHQKIARKVIAIMELAQPFMIMDHIKGVLKTVLVKALVNIYLTMETPIVATIKIICAMVKVNTNGKMAIVTGAAGLMVKEMVLAFIPGLTEHDMKGSGKMTHAMAKAN
jgi:hypothetical protein